MFFLKKKIISLDYKNNFIYSNKYIDPIFFFKKKNQNILFLNRNEIVLSNKVDSIELKNNLYFIKYLLANKLIFFIK